MTYCLVFGFSTSRDYARAVRIAGSFPGYTNAGADRDIRHSVPVDAALPLIEDLLVLVGAWRSSVLLAEGVPIGRPAALRAVLACQRTCARSGLGELHCWGLPALERGRVPCRLLERVLRGPISSQGGRSYSSGEREKRSHTGRRVERGNARAPGAHPLIIVTNTGILRAGSCRPASGPKP